MHQKHPYPREHLYIKKNYILQFILDDHFTVQVEETGGNFSVKTNSQQTTLPV